MYSFVHALQHAFSRTSIGVYKFRNTILIIELIVFLSKDIEFSIIINSRAYILAFNSSFFLPYRTDVELYELRVNRCELNGTNYGNNTRNDNCTLFLSQYTSSAREFWEYALTNIVLC